MIRFLLLIIAIAVCLGIAPFFIDQKGYVLIAFNKTTIEGHYMGGCSTYCAGVWYCLLRV